MSQSTRVTLRCSARLQASDVASMSTSVPPGGADADEEAHGDGVGVGVGDPDDAGQSPAAGWPVRHSHRGELADCILYVGGREARRTGRDRNHDVERCAGGGDLDPGQLS